MKGSAPDKNGFAPKFGVIALLNGREEGIKVDVDNLSHGESHRLFLMMVPTCSVKSHLNDYHFIHSFS